MFNIIDFWFFFVQQVTASSKWEECRPLLEETPEFRWAMVFVHLFHFPHSFVDIAVNQGHLHLTDLLVVMFLQSFHRGIFSEEGFWGLCYSPAAESEGKGSETWEGREGGPWSSSKRGDFLLNTSITLLCILLLRQRFIMACSGVVKRHILTLVCYSIISE